MTDNTRRKTLLLLGLILLITMVMGAALPQLELQPGMPLPSVQEGLVVAAVPADEEVGFVSMPAPTFLLILIELILAGAILYSMYRVLRGEGWRSILEVLRPILIITLILVGLIFLILQLPGSDRYTPAEIQITAPEPVVTSPLGAVPAPVLWWVGVGLLVLAGLVGLWIFSPSRQAGAIELVGREAERARQALRTGADLKDVIIDCYRQMSLALKQEQGIERKEFMTTGEFEQFLHSAGIPREPIHQLTRLFDAVRYGHWQPNAAEEQMAIQCLEAIMHYSRAATERE